LWWGNRWGLTDEDLTQPTTCGVGECAGNTGTETCTAGVWGGDTCDPFEGAIPEVCEGFLDENCDGVVDEGCDCTIGDTKSFTMIMLMFQMLAWEIALVQIMHVEHQP